MELTEAKLRNAHFLSAADPTGECGTFVEVLDRIRESRKALDEIAKLPLGDHRAQKIAEAALRPEVMSNTAGDFDPSDLTDQEKRIVALVVQGCTNREIAAKLGMAEDVIKHGLYCNICDKLGVSNRLELAQFILQHPLDRD
jgi:DNA-binding NarL/FixJ family response regulator